MNLTQIANLLRSRGSPMARELPAIAREAQRAGVPLAYVLGIAGAESEFGTTGYARGRHNPFGYGIHSGLDYPTYAAATRAMLKGIRSPTYRGQQTIRGIANIYAPSSENDTVRYAGNVARIASMFGGRYTPGSDVIGAADQSLPDAPTIGGGGQQTTGLAAGNNKAALLSAVMGMQSKDPTARLASLLQVKSLRQAASTVGGAAQDAASAVSGAASDLSGIPLTGASAGVLTMGGGPEAHGTRALGNWQSDLAWDLMGKAGQRIYSPVTGRVVKVSGQPGGNPQFAGYGITVQTPQGQLFFKHLGSTPLKQGMQLRRGGLVGLLEAVTGGGPHLHLGAQNRALGARLADYYK